MGANDDKELRQAAVDFANEMDAKYQEARKVIENLVPMANKFTEIQDYVLEVRTRRAYTHIPLGEVLTHIEEIIKGEVDG